MKYIIDDFECEVVIEKKNNKNTYIRIKDNNTILITTNFFTSKKDIIKLIEDNKAFILKNLQRQQRKQEKEEKFYFLGDAYDIIYMPTKLEIIDSRIYVKDEKELNKWLNKQIKQIFKERLDYIYEQFEENIPYPNLRIRSMKTRWGVCNKKLKTVTLNSELIKYSIDKLDYVIVHELSHFIHFDHSASFWLLVSKYCPFYKKVRKELKD